MFVWKLVFLPPNRLHDSITRIPLCFYSLHHKPVITLLYVALCITEIIYVLISPFPVAVRYKAIVWSRLTLRFVGSNPAEGMDVCPWCLCCLGNGLCVELITHSEESYRVCVVCVLCLCVFCVLCVCVCCVCCVCVCVFCVLCVCVVCVCCVVWSTNLINRRPTPNFGCCATEQNEISYFL
jgi:hypothetical protein